MFRANIYGPLDGAVVILHTKKLCSRLYSIEVEFYFKKNKKIAFWATLWGLTGNVRTPSIARLEAVVDFLFVIIEFFLQSLTVETLHAEYVEVDVFRRGWVTLIANFRRKGASSTNHCWCQKTRVTAILCGIDILAMHCLVLSQSTRVTDGRSDRQNYDS